jgi:flagellar protein FlaJ
MRARRYGKLKRQLPTMLKKILSANETGMSLVDSFELASESMSGQLGKELKRTQNEIRWRADMEEGLVRFARKVDEPRLSRTIKLLTKANEYTGNLTEVLSVATRDIVDTTRLDRDRKNQMRIYTGIIMMAFFVYLFVIVMLNQSFLQEIAQISEEFGGSSGTGQLSGQSGFNITSFDITTYNMLFFHSSLIQAFGSGFIAGQMGSDNLYSGIKWGLILVSISTIVFVFVL